jgi:hypothetical protein
MVVVVVIFIRAAVDAHVRRSIGVVERELDRGQGLEGGRRGGKGSEKRRERECGEADVGEHELGHRGRAPHDLRDYLHHKRHPVHQRPPHMNWPPSVHLRCLAHLRHSLHTEIQIYLTNFPLLVLLKRKMPRVWVPTRGESDLVLLWKRGFPATGYVAENYWMFACVMILFIVAKLNQLLVSFFFFFFSFFFKKKIIYCLFITLLREESGGPYDVDTWQPIGPHSFVAAIIYAFFFLIVKNIFLAAIIFFYIDLAAIIWSQWFN